MGILGFMQANRIVRVDGLLGPDQLLVERMKVRESISELFDISLQVLSKNKDIAPDQLLGNSADISLTLDQNKRRNWNAIVTEMTAGTEVSQDHYLYQLTLKPQLWLLGQKSDCRIWMDMTSVEVCETLLSEHGIDVPVKAGIFKEVPKQHYSVQYNETDLDYLNRRLEEDGIFYWFEHELGKHVLHIANFPNGYTGDDDTRLRIGASEHDSIQRFDTKYRYTPGKFAGRDWNFETPELLPEAKTPSIVKLPHNSDYELYEYPVLGGYGEGERASEGIQSSAVERQTRLRMQAVEADHQKVSGESSERSLSPGFKFTPFDVANPKNKFDPYVTLSVEHEAINPSYGNKNQQDLAAKKIDGDEQGAEPEYRNSFVAIPAKIPATPHKKTLRPRIDGSQLAFVAGPEGEEIHPDEYGRVKVWFPWDRRAKKDGSDTCWVRVMQNWAGGGWGGQIIPRIGMEVMITFFEGDPDRPAIVGAVPNKKQKVPYPLPKHKTKSVFRTDTHKGDGFNELTFEDKTDEEKIYLHAQKDHEIHVENNRSKRVDQNQSESVGNNKSIEVGNNHHEVIGGNMTLMVGPNKLQQAVTSKFKAFASAIGDFANKLGVPDALNMGEGNLIVGVAKNKAETVMVSSNEIVGGAKTLTVGGGYQVSVAGIRNESTLLGSFEEVGQNKVVVAGKRMEFVCGKSKIQLNEDGTVNIEGVTINLKGSSRINLN